jgi:hypothetical protein
VGRRPRQFSETEAREFADDLSGALDRLPDMDATEDHFVFPRAFWGKGKDRLRGLVALARAGAFVWGNPKGDWLA